MISWTRCSGSALAFLVAALLAEGCVHAPAPAEAPSVGHASGPLPRVVLLPIDNASRAPAPLDELAERLAVALSDRFEVIRGEALEPFLAKHRLRYTGGVDLDAVRAARAELGADAILLTTLLLYEDSGSPLLGLATRLVSTDEEPAILWMDAVSHAGDEAPGLLGLGRVTRIATLTERVLSELRGSLAASLDGKGAPQRCAPERGRTPKVRFRSVSLDRNERHTLAVVPFLNLTPRAGAGDAVALEFVRQLVASGRYRVLEPGVVRDYLLRARVIMPGGVSLETTRMLMGGLGVELVMSGVVLDFDDALGNRPPAVRFGAMLLDAGSGDVVWSSSSFSTGSDGVYFFGLGRVADSQQLTCRVVASVVSRMNKPGGVAYEWSEREQRMDPRRYTREGREEDARRASGSASP